MIRFITYIILFYNIFLVNAFADVIKKIEINGNKVISNDAIISIINFKKNKNYSLEDINNFQKLIYKTDFFETVKINIVNNAMIIDLKENPMINFFYINGVKNKSRLKNFKDILSLQQNKIFSENLLKSDINLIKNEYRNSGYYNVEVTPEISKLPNNLINVVLKVDRKNKLEINRINFLGNNSFSDRVLNNVISSSERGWWKFFSSTATVSSGRIEYDVSLLKRFYLDNGFYDIQVNSADIQIIDDMTASIVFSLQEGKKYSFSKFEIKDDNKFLNNKNILEINKIIKSRFKNNFSQSKLQLIKDEINFYFIRNKLEFINLIVNLNKQEKNIDAVFILQKSQRNFVNTINISGNSITEENVIRRNLEYASGDPLSLHKLQKSEDNLKTLGIFENIETKINNIGNELTDVDIKVSEKPTGTISAGLGIGSDESSISTSIQEKNLFGKGIDVNSNISLSTEKITGFVSTKIPDFKNTNNDFYYSIYARSTDYTNAGYENTLVGNSISLEYDIFEDISIKPGVGLEFDKIDTTPTASALYKSRDGNYLTLKSYYDIFTDKRDSKFLPTNGHKFGFGQSFALPGSDIVSLENFVYGSYYKPISKNYIFSYKGGLNSINALQDSKDVKLSDRLFLNNSKLRGFESFGTGPKDGKDHIGGNYSFYSSFSSTFPNYLPKKWNANSIVFLDTGNVWGVDFDDNLDKEKLRSAFGVSLDWISPIGPLSFTLSEAVTHHKEDKTENFKFKIGSTF